MIDHVHVQARDGCHLLVVDFLRQNVYLRHLTFDELQPHLFTYDLGYVNKRDRVAILEAGRDVFENVLFLDFFLGDG